MYSSISILYSLKTPDHWYMRYNIIIYTNSNGLQVKVTKKEKQNTANAKKGKKIQNTCKYREKNSQEEQTLFRIFLIRLESDFRVLI